MVPFRCSRPWLGPLCCRCRLRALPRTGSAVPSGAGARPRSAGLTAPGRHCPQPEGSAAAALGLSAIPSLSESWGRPQRPFEGGFGSRRALRWAVPPAGCHGRSPQSGALLSSGTAAFPPPPSLPKRGTNAATGRKQFVHFVSNLSETKNVVLKDFKGILWGSSCCVVIREAADRAARAALCREQAGLGRFCRACVDPEFSPTILTEFSVSPRILGL